MRIRSTVTDRIYEQEEMVFIVNVKQIAYYLKCHCTIFDLIESDGKLVGVFSKRESRPYYEKWQELMQ